MLVDVLEWNIRNFPQAFQTGGDVLHHLFCVAGNGYEWVDGVLVSKFYPDISVDVVKRPDEWRASLVERSAAGDVFAGSVLREILLQEASGRLVALEADSRAEIWELSPETRFYPESEYALLKSIPSNVRPDWLEAADWVNGLAVAHGWDVSVF
tara:strand:- start:29 stop:490 length:462 start_codon:yes stop_codon:yes gene_type:complete